MTFIDLANQAVESMFDSLNDLAERYGAEITDYEELVRALRAQVEFHRYVAAGRAESVEDAAAAAIVAPLASMDEWRRSLDEAEADYDRNGGVSWSEARKALS